MQRLAYSLMQELDQLINAYPQFEWVGLMPSRSIQAQYNYQFRNIQIKQCGRLSGHLWEQLELPFYARAGVLLNLCNTAPLLKFKQFITLHDVIFMTNLDSHKWWFKLWYQIIARVTSYSAFKVFTVSEFSKSELVKYLKLKASRVVVLGNAPSLHSYTYVDTVLSRFNLATKQYFLMIGSNSLRKNTQMVAQLFASNPSLQSWHLVIVGGDFANLAMVKPVVANNITYTGYVTDGELRSLYHHAQSLIFPSIYEGFGIPVLEAMAEDCVVIASDIPVLHEVCANAALYFAPTNPAELLSQIQHLISHPDLSSSLKQTAKAQLANYQWVRFAKILLATIVKSN